MYTKVIWSVAELYLHLEIWLHGVSWVSSTDENLQRLYFRAARLCSNGFLLPGRPGPPPAPLLSHSSGFYELQPDTSGFGRCQHLETLLRKMIHEEAMGRILLTLHEPHANRRTWPCLLHFGRLGARGSNFLSSPVVSATTGSPAGRGLGQCPAGRLALDGLSITPNRVEARGQ